METRTTQNQSINRKKDATGRIRFVSPAACLAGVAVLSAIMLARPAAAQSTTPTSGQGAGPSTGTEAAMESDSKDRILFVRPHAGVGWASAYNRHGNALALHAGGRLLFPSPLSPKVDAKFGLEATYVQLDITGSNIFEERYAAVGVVLEMTVVRGFNLGIGTLGYIGVAGTDRNPFGLVTNLGWEPTWDARVRPYITMRTEWIFDRATYNVLSLSAGITFGI